MVCKLLGLGLLKYVKDKLNIFDGIIVITSLIDIGLSLFNLKNSANF